MSLLRNTVVLAALATVAAVASVAVAGCTGSTSGTGPTADATSESSGDDVAIDGQSTPETGDVLTAPDADATTRSDADASSLDAADADATSTGADADSSTTTDADAAGGGDALEEADAPVTADASDANTEAAPADAGTEAEAGIVVPQALLDYPKNVATAYCQHAALCCGLTGSFNMAQCIIDNTSYGWKYTLPESSYVLPRGNVTWDPDAGAARINAMSSFACPTSTASQWASVTDTCFAVLKGTLPVGQGPCISSY